MHTCISNIVHKKKKELFQASTGQSIVTHGHDQKFVVSLLSEDNLMDVPIIYWKDIEHCKD